MKESNREGQASHPGPESCRAAREDRAEARTGVRTGEVFSCENEQSGMPTPSADAEGNTHGGRHGKPSRDPARPQTLACTETPYARTVRSQVLPACWQVGTHWEGNATSR